MDGQWTRARAGSQPVADELALEQERAAGAALVCRPLAFGLERAVGDADGRDVEHRAEVEGQAGAARVVAAGGVDQEDVRRLGSARTAASSSAPSRNASNPGS